MQQKLVRIIQRFNPAATWQQYNPVLLVGELGIESDTFKAKLGDGTTTWNSLDYCISMESLTDYTAGAGIILDADGVLSTQLQYSIIGEIDNG